MRQFEPHQDENTYFYITRQRDNQIEKILEDIPDESSAYFFCNFLNQYAIEDHHENRN